MDAGIINPFLEAALDVTRTMANTESTVGQPSLKQSSLASGEITGFIKLSGPEHNGSLALTFNLEAILLIYERMLGEKITSLDDSALDLAGEVTNMVCGGAKARLAQKGYDFDLTQPTVLSGTEYTVEHPGNYPVISLPLKLEQGRIFIEVSLSR